jgi:heme-degrading monooxygenase HmoA
MIVRTWRGWAAASNRAAYPDHFRKHVLPELKEIAGFLGASLLQQERLGEVEFLVLTRWASIDAVRAFAGDDISGAVVEPEAAAALVRFDRSVQHYEVIEETEPD